MHKCTNAHFFSMGLKRSCTCSFVHLKMHKCTNAQFLAFDGTPSHVNKMRSIYKSICIKHFLSQRMHLWPSGLRRRFQAPLISISWVQIPQGANIFLLWILREWVQSIEHKHYFLKRVSSFKHSKGFCFSTTSRQFIPVCVVELSGHTTQRRWSGVRAISISVKHAFCFAIFVALYII